MKQQPVKGVYTRLSTANKNYITKIAKKNNIAQSTVINAYFTFLRTGKVQTVKTRSGQSVTFGV